MANKWVEFIESDRSETMPKIGDRVRWTNKYGEYYHYAHIERIDDDSEAEVWERPYVPFVFKRDDNTLGCSTSGGAWQFIPVKELPTEDIDTTAIYLVPGFFELGPLSFNSSLCSYKRPSICV